MVMRGERSGGSVVVNDNDVDGSMMGYGVRMVAWCSGDDGGGCSDGDDDDGGGRFMVMMGDSSNGSVVVDDDDVDGSMMGCGVRMVAWCSGDDGGGAAVVTWESNTKPLDETSVAFLGGELYNLEIENLVDKKVKIIRCDNGTEFKNRVMSEFCEKKGIKKEFSVARTPQQNGVAERRNKTLIRGC
ncbi:putative ribonuclease H-like domain-containing protein [Tanacetum coccineum]